MIGSENMKIAMLIDAENISYKYTQLLFDEASRYGLVICKRIYGDWSSPALSSWRASITDYSIHAIQQFQNTSGKNSSDSALIIDAMDLLHDGRYECFCIVSSDSDYTRLASRLRESEKYVIGMGEQKAPVSFRNACDKYIFLDLLLKQIQNNSSKTNAVNERINEKSSDAQSIFTPAVANLTGGLSQQVVLSTIKEIIAGQSDEDGWIYLADLGNMLSKKLPDFDVRNFGFEKLSKFIASTNEFRIDSRPAPKNPSVKYVYVSLKT